MIELVDYNPEWPRNFEQLRQRLMCHLANLTFQIEHVGSTAVIGLPAKPAIDLDVIVDTQSNLFAARERLKRLGYICREHLSMTDRRAFKLPGFAHNLYVCLRDGISLFNHITFRDHLRTHPADAARYGELKRALARKFPDDKCNYIEGKTVFVISVLQQHGASKHVINEIRRANDRLCQGLRKEQESF